MTGTVPSVFRTVRVLGFFDLFARLEFLDFVAWTSLSITAAMILF